MIADACCSRSLGSVAWIILEKNERVGAERSLSKTDVIYYSTDEDLAQQAVGWRVEEVSTKASVSLASSNTNTLGVATSPAEFVNAQLKRKTRVVKAMHERVQLCQDPQTEFVLATESSGVGRVNHILRVHVQSLAERGGSAAAFDEVGRLSLERVFPGLTNEGHSESTLSAAEGGLGWRQALDVARPAHLGGLIATAPRVKAMIQAGADAGLLPAATLGQRFDAIVTTEESAYLGELDEVDKVQAEDFLRRAKLAAEAAWDRIVSGGTGPEHAGPRVPHYDGQNEDEDADERRMRGARISAPQLQRELSVLADRTKARRLEITLQRQGAWAQLDRLKELRHKDVSHRWLRNLDTRASGVLTSVDFVANVQKRLGCRSYTGLAPCRLCGGHIDAHLEHSETCSTAEATRGHYACVRAVVDRVRLADPAVTTEPRGLTSTTSRLADIFTTAAVPGRGAALDVCVWHPRTRQRLWVTLPRQPSVGRCVVTELKYSN